MRPVDAYLADARALTEAEFIDKHGAVLFLYTCGMMICCGTIGGSLYDIRGLIKHSTNNDFDPLCTLSYLLRPIAGGLSSLVAFSVRQDTEKARTPFLLLAAVADNLTEGGLR